MPHDPNATPLEVLQRYKEELWNSGHLERIPEIVANPMRRHYPGRLDLLDHAQLRERMKRFSENYENIRFYSVFDVCEGPYVTTVWETTADITSGGRVLTAGIEVFKIENGLITDVWNGHAEDGQWATGVLWDRKSED